MNGGRIVARTARGKMKISSQAKDRVTYFANCLLVGSCLKAMRVVSG